MRLSTKGTLRNPGGPGNPYARQTAALRRALLEAVTEEQIQDIIKSLVTQARLGSLPAARLVLAYVIGKPTAARDPDRVELEEWEMHQEKPTYMDLKEKLPERCPTVVVNAAMRGAELDHARLLGEGLKASAERERAAKEEAGLAASAQASGASAGASHGPKANGQNGGTDRAGPMANGQNGGTDRAGPMANGQNGRWPRTDGRSQTGKTDGAMATERERVEAENGRGMIERTSG